eukprot:c38812_g1_i1 orf=404-2272(+)
MATTPGPLYSWPWEILGNFKYALYFPLAMKAAHANFMGGYDLDNVCLHLLIISGLRYLLVQLWCTASRLPCVSGKYQIQTKGVRFEQVDRESGWENMIILNAYIIWTAHQFIPSYFANIPLCNVKGLVTAILTHVGPVEFTYYWAHRALHHHALYKRYHSHHHSSFVTEPTTSSNHPFIEQVLYAIIYGFALEVPFLLGWGSVVLIYAYLLWLDFMNVWGHCNFEFVPTWVFKTFPLLKYLVYTPSFHSLHHTRVHTNFCLYMPLYDYMYGTAESTSDSLYYSIRKGREEHVNCVYLTHVTELFSIFHFQFGFRSFAANPYAAKWYIWLLWPLAIPFMLLSWLFAQPFVADNCRLGTLEMQSWAIPRYNFQYSLPSEKPRINRMIEQCILEAQRRGAKVVALGLRNKDETLNGGGEQFVTMHKELKIPIINGSTLTVSAVVKRIPKETREVFIVGASTKIGRGIALYLSKRGMKVLAFLPSRNTFETLQKAASEEFRHNLIHVSKYQAGEYCKTWIIGEQIDGWHQRFAPKGTHFHLFTEFSISKSRTDCTYGSVPALRLPNSIQNLHACEETMPRYVVHACHAAAVLHALEGWTHHEVGDVDIERVDSTWEAALKHGMTPF